MTTAPSSAATVTAATVTAPKSPRASSPPAAAVPSKREKELTAEIQAMNARMVLLEQHLSTKQGPADAPAQTDAAAQ